jgi:hypothetical protein
MTTTSADVKLSGELKDRVAAMDILELCGVRYPVAKVNIDMLERGLGPVAVHLPMMLDHFNDQRHFTEEMGKAGLCVVFLTRKEP